MSTTKHSYGPHHKGGYVGLGLFVSFDLFRGDPCTVYTYSSTILFAWQRQRWQEDLRRLWLRWKRLWFRK